MLDAQNKFHYGPNGIRTTVLVGDTGYSSWRKLVNKPGSDGTVYVSSANLGTMKIVVDLQTLKVTFGEMPVEAKIAFGIVPSKTHSSIVSDAVGDADEAKHSPLHKLVRRALDCATPTDFSTLATELKERYRTTNKGVFQQIVFSAVDQHGNAVSDYDLSFDFVAKPTNERIGELAGNDIFDWHTNGRQKHRRSLLVNHTKLRESLHATIEEARKNGVDAVELTVDIFVRDIKPQIVYKYEGQRVPLLHIDVKNNTMTIAELVEAAFSGSNKSKQKTFLYPHATTLIELRLFRETSLVAVESDAKKLEKIIEDIYRKRPK